MWWRYDRQSYILTISKLITDEPLAFASNRILQSLRPILCDQEILNEGKSCSRGNCADQNNWQCQLCIYSYSSTGGKVEFSFSAREIITEIVSLTISKITVTDIESIHLTLTNEELWYEHEIWLEEAQRSSIIYMFIDIKKLRTYFVRRI